MSKQQNHKVSSKKGVGLFGASCLFLSVTAFGAVAYTVMAQQETANKVDALTDNISALVQLQQQQVDPAIAAREALDGHFASEREKARNALIATAPAAQDDDIPDGKHLYGDPGARYTLVEFSDYHCPYCQRFHSTPKQIVESSGGNVNWEYIHFPLGAHNPGAMELAIASECISEELGNKAFWAYTNAVFNDGSSNADMRGIAENLGMDSEDLSACMSDSEMMARVQEDMDKAAQAGVTGTPSSFIVDNVTGDIEVISGAQPLQNVVQKLQSLVERNKEVVVTDEEAS